MIARSIAIIVGVAILCATAHISILANGGYGQPFSYVIMAVTAGVAVGCVFAGMAWSDGRKGVAAGLVTAIVAGEAFGMIATAERIIEGREAKQAPLRAQELARAKAQERVRAAELALSAVPETTERLRKAEASKAAADAAVIEKSAERSCAANCRQLLQAQVDAAATELESARAELAALKTAAERKLADALQALDAIVVRASSTPLADRVGVEPWILDLAHSGLGTTAANGLACLLLIFGAHHRPQRVEVVMPERHLDTRRQVPPKRRRLSPRDHAARFGMECFVRGGEAEIVTIYQRYRRWCHSASDDPYPEKEIARAMGELFTEAGIEVVERDGNMIALGVSLKEQHRQAWSRCEGRHVAA